MSRPILLSTMNNGEQYAPFTNVCVALAKGEIVANKGRCQSSVGEFDLRQGACRGAVFQGELGGMEVTAETWPDEQASWEDRSLLHCIRSIGAPYYECWSAGPEPLVRIDALHNTRSVNAPS